MSDSSHGTTEVATLGGGCFWCIDAVLRRLDGVEKVVSGYAGGDVPDPTYRQVCTGRTGHAEVVQVHFDPERIAYGDLLDVFFTVHDPTQRGRQGADVGPQYRSIILVHSKAQEREAEEAIRAIEAEGRWKGRVVTEVVPFDTFYPAEEDHQDYFRRNPGQPYCRVVISPKLEKLRARHPGRLAGGTDGEG